jgi:hypothetical protein
MAITAVSNNFVPPPIVVIAANNIVSLDSDHPNSINTNLQPAPYAAACWNLCLDIKEKLGSRPLLREIFTFLGNHTRYLVRATVRPKDCPLALTLDANLFHLEDTIDRFQRDDAHLSWNLFPEADGDFGDSYRVVDQIELCHFTFIKGPNKGGLPTTIAHPTGDKFNYAIAKCQELWETTLDPRRSPAEADDDIRDLHWWLLQTAPFKADISEAGVFKRKRERDDASQKNYNETFIEIIIAALYFHKFGTRRSYEQGVSSYHFALTSSLIEFRNLYPTLFR